MPTALRTKKHPEIAGRARQLAQLELTYQFHDSFLQRDLEPEFLADPIADESDRRPSRVPRDMPAHLGRLCERKLLSVGEERQRFRRMNYAKYRADVLRRTLDVHTPSRQKVAEIERLLALAARDRDEIVTANLRLVISIARKFVNESLTFDELLSDGIDALLRAAEKFDFSRGFRFSTYATTAIRHTLQRVRQNAYRDRQRFVVGQETLFDNTPSSDEAEATTEEPLTATQRLAIHDLIQRLSTRDQYIITRRFGLDCQTQTLQSLSEELGICKERVRQLEMRARSKILSFAQEQHLLPSQSA